MSYRINYGPSFRRELKHLCKRYRSIKEDYLHFLEYIQDRPFAGIDLGSGVRKHRMAITSKNKGKSGGARVITITAVCDKCEGTITLLYIYDKSERENITDGEIQALINELQ